MKVKHSLVTSTALLLLALIVASISTATVTKDYCAGGKCTNCVASAKDSTYNSCTECTNSKSVLVNTSTDCGLSDCSSVPNDVYYCTGSIAVANCLIEYSDSETQYTGCKFCKQGYKQKSSSSGTKTAYSCESHGVENCVAWDISSNTQCEACDEGYEMTSSFTCTKSSSSLLSNCKYHTYKNSALSCFTCKKEYGLSSSGTCTTENTKGCRDTLSVTESGTCSVCAFEAGWYSTGHGTSNQNQICTYFTQSSTDTSTNNSGSTNNSASTTGSNSYTKTILYNLSSMLLIILINWISL